MNEPRTVFCKKLEKEAPGLPFKPFTDDFGQELFDHVSMEAWQMWLRESPRYVNTYGLDLQSEKGREFLRGQMKIFFNFEKGDLADTAWVPEDKPAGSEADGDGSGSDPAAS